MTLYRVYRRRLLDHIHLNDFDNRDNAIDYAHDQCKFHTINKDSIYVKRGDETYGYEYICTRHKLKINLIDITTD